MCCVFSVSVSVRMSLYTQVYTFRISKCNSVNGWEYCRFVSFRFVHKLHSKDACELRTVAERHDAEMNEQQQQKKKPIYLCHTVTVYMRVKRYRNGKNRQAKPKENWTFRRISKNTKEKQTEKLLKNLQSIPSELSCVCVCLCVCVFSCSLLLLFCSTYRAISEYALRDRHFVTVCNQSAVNKYKKQNSIETTEYLFHPFRQIFERMIIMVYWQFKW